MRGEAMSKVVTKLKENNIDLSQYSVLEYFAREGDWQTLAYFPHVKSLTAWEIDPAFETRLRQNLSGAEIEIGDSYQLATQSRFQRRFNMIVLDNPQGIFGDKNYCEHFEAIPAVMGLFKEKNNVLMFNINTQPFGYDTQPEWKLRREKFYGNTSTQELSQEFITSFYKGLLTKLGANVKELWVESRNAQYLHYVVCIFDLP